MNFVLMLKLFLNMIERDNLSICKCNNKGLDCCCYRFYVFFLEKNFVESYRKIIKF